LIEALLDEHEDVIDVDLDLLDELNLEDDVLVDALPVCVLTLPELGIEVEIARPRGQGGQPVQSNRPDNADRTSARYTR
jgi:hypothetical protein